MSHRRIDEAGHLHRLLESIDEDLAVAKQSDPAPLALIRALTMEREKVLDRIAAEEAR